MILPSVNPTNPSKTVMMSLEKRYSTKFKDKDGETVEAKLSSAYASGGASWLFHYPRDDRIFISIAKCFD